MVNTVPQDERQGAGGIFGLGYKEMHELGQKGCPLFSFELFSHIPNHKDRFINSWNSF